MAGIVLIVFFKIQDSIALARYMRNKSQVLFFGVWRSGDLTVDGSATDHSRPAIMVNKYPLIRT